MSPMAGGEGPLARGTAKSAAAAAEPQGPLKRYPSKGKAKKESAMATGPHGSSKGCSTKRKAVKDPASGRTPRPRATANATGRKAEVVVQAAVVAGEPKNRLTKGEIRRILAEKPTPAPARFAALKQSNPELIPRPDEEADEDKKRLYRLVKAFYEMEERLPRLQEWVRGELKRKGYVEIDEETAKRKAEVQAVIDREWPEIEAKMKEMILFDKEYGGSEDDSDSDEGEDDSDEGEDDDEAN